MKLSNPFKARSVDSPPAPAAAPSAYQSPKSSLRREGPGLLLLVLIAVLVALFIKAFVIQPYVVDGESMFPTLHNGDRLLVDKLPNTVAHITHHSYIPRRGDIIIFTQNNLPGYIGARQLVKRVIGLPGDTVVIENSTVTVFNKAHPKGFDPDRTGAYSIGVITAPDSTNVIKSGQLFVMGDNRTNSEDSRYFGPIPISEIVGKLALRIYPLNQAKHF